MSWYREEEEAEAAKISPQRMMVAGLGEEVEVWQ